MLAYIPAPWILWDIVNLLLERETGLKFEVLMLHIPSIWPELAWSWCCEQWIFPIGSMYGIYGNIYHQYTPNVSIYTSTMDPMGLAWYPPVNITFAKRKPWPTQFDDLPLKKCWFSIVMWHVQRVYRYIHQMPLKNAMKMLTFIVL